ncbi:hypothetical protein F0562_017480 [Nyssa sinensis]|uniref:Methyltransferase n=1 Tax=Nyssa sinensis TaxID=561372 RepID=A0A5J4ZEY7_9ASTE|nr:hypothetical protein F0562_017480 [Nyssa sinensis]
MNNSFRAPTKPSSNLASTSSQTNQTWLLDSGTTHHLTADLDNLAIHSEYTGPEEVTLGDLCSAGVVQVLDVGCGVASFSAYLLPLDMQTMSFAPKDGHEDQIQFALEPGIGAMISASATKQLHGILVKEVNRLLRSNGYFAYSAPPAYGKDKDYPMIWDTYCSRSSYSNLD